MDRDVNIIIADDADVTIDQIKSQYDDDHNRFSVSIFGQGSGFEEDEFSEIIK